MTRERLTYLLKVAWDCGYCAAKMPIFEPDADPQAEKEQDVRKLVEGEQLEAAE